MIQRTKKSLGKVAFLSIIIAAMGKIFGLLREMLMASYYGASAYADAYVMSIMIPLIIMGFIHSFSVVFTPIYIKTREESGISIADRYFKQLILIIIGISIVIISIIELCTPLVIDIIASGFNDETKELTCFFTRISIFTGLTSALVELCLAFFRCNGYYIFASVLSLIVSPTECVFIILGGMTQKWILILGPVVAHGCIIITSILFIEAYTKQRREKYSSKFSLKNEIKHSFTMVVPIFLGSMASQISTYVDKIFASNLPSGTVASLNYAEKIYSMANTLVFLTISTVLFPNVSELCQKKDNGELKTQLCTIINIIVILGVIISIVSIVFRQDIVTVLYERGSFTKELTRSTSISFALYMIGFFALGIHEILSRVFYGLDRSKLELIIGLLIVLVNIFFDFVLVKTIGLIGLPIATSLSLMFSLPVNWFLLRKEIGVFSVKNHIVVFFKCSFAAIWGYGLIKYIVIWCGLENVFIRLFICLILGSIMTLITLKLFHLKELDDFIRLMKLKFERKK